jgi:hypothetical protein
MEKDEIRQHIKHQFEEIVKLEDNKKALIEPAKKQLSIILNEFIPQIVEQEKEIGQRVNEIKLAALELKENYTCNSGRVVYFEPWQMEKEFVTIQGIQLKLDRFCFCNYDEIDGIIEAFLYNISKEEAKEGGDQN